MDFSRGPLIDPPKDFAPVSPRRGSSVGMRDPRPRRSSPAPRPPAPVPFLAKHYVSSDTENQEVGRDLEETGYKVRALPVHSGP